MITGERRNQLNTIIGRMKDNGESDDSIQEAVFQFKTKYTTSDSQPEKEPAGATRSFGDPSPYEKFGAAGAVFPRTAESAERGGKIGTRTLAAIGDIATIPQRAVAGVAAMTGYRWGEGSAPPGPMAQEGLKQFSRYKPEAGTTGLTKFAQNIAYDPTLIPGLAVGSTEAKLMSKVPGLAKALIPAASGAIQAGGSSAIQQATEGDVDLAPTAKSAGIGAAVPLAVAGGTAAVKKVAGSAGKRLIQALIRPGQRGMKEGFDPDYIMNDKELLAAAGDGIEKLQGTLKERFNSLANQVKQVQSTTGQSVNVDVPAIYFRTARKLKGSNDFTGMKRELLDALDGLQDNLYNETEMFDEFTDLATAMKLRTNYGTKVNWQPGIASGGRKAAMGAGAEEKVYDTFYKELSAEIKKQAPDAIKEIDEQFTKLIPVLKATNRRVLVETSNLPVGLMEGVGGAGVGAVSALGGEGDFGKRLKRGLIGAAAGAAGTKILKSPRTGAALYNFSNLVNIPPAVSTATPFNALRETMRPDENEEDGGTPYEKLSKTIKKKGSYR